MQITITELESLTLTTLQQKYSKKDALLIKDVVIFGELSEKTSHGIIRLFTGNSSIMAQNPTGEPTITHKTKLSSIIEGNNNPGMLIGPLAMKEAIKIGKEHGFGIVGTRKSTSSSGCISYYLEQIAKENLITIIMAQSPVSTVAHGGIEPLFGTNPISFGIPSLPQPLLFDMATAAISFGAMLKAKELIQQLPPNVALDKSGNPTTDPQKAMEGATLAFDNSYKGSGLAMMVEILSGAWPGADFVGKNPEGGWGNTFMVFSPDLLSDIDVFKQNTSILIETVRASKTKNGNTVRIPGENTINVRNSNIKSGTIEIEEKIYNELKKVASN